MCINALSLMYIKCSTSIVRVPIHEHGDCSDILEFQCFGADMIN